MPSPAPPAPLSSAAAHSTVVAFPLREAPRTLRPVSTCVSRGPFVPSRREYGLGEVARLTGLSHVSHKVLLASLRKLAEQAHMPLPKTPRFHAGKLMRGAASIGAQSRWDAMAFDDWLDDFTPPGGASVTPRAAPPPVTAAMREDMAARAATLAQIGRKRA